MLSSKGQVRGTSLLVREDVVGLTPMLQPDDGVPHEQPVLERMCGGSLAGLFRGCAGMCSKYLEGGEGLGGPPPHPVIVTIRDNSNYIRVLLYS